MFKEGFCLACLAAPVALIVSNQSNVVLDSKSLYPKEIKYQQQKQKFQMYGSLLFFILSSIATFYFINGGCKECS